MWYCAIVWFAIIPLFSSGPKTTYTTDTATKGTLITTVTASGNISSANSASVGTQTSGVVSKLYVKNGDPVKSGDPIADVNLDMNGQQNATQALASYQNAKNSLSNAQAQMFSLQSTMFGKWYTFTQLAENSTYQNPDGSPNTSERTLAQFTEPQDDWLAAEAQYANQQNVVAAAQTSVNSAWANYELTSPTIYAPIAGTISGLSLQVGSVLTAQQAQRVRQRASGLPILKRPLHPLPSSTSTKLMFRK